MNNKRFFIQIVNNYHAYLSNLLKNTLRIGIASFIINWLYVNSSLHTFKIHWEIQGLIGFVIGLLLVFRTNTAYDRWWEGRKMLSDFSKNIKELKLISMTNDKLHDMEEDINRLVNAYFTFLHLGTKEKEYETNKIFNFLYVKACEFPDSVKTATLRILSDLNQSIHTGERIKRTPIPLAYKLHIKVVLYAYLFSLPFSSFYSMGLYSSIMVMILYFLISGIELISTEIEDPFAGEPNDLPMKELKKSLLHELNN